LPDFYTGATPTAAKELVLKAFDRHLEISNQVFVTLTVNLRTRTRKDKKSYNKKRLEQRSYLLKTV
jgi:hypothetical protein